MKILLILCCIMCTGCSATMIEMVEPLEEGAAYLSLMKMTAMLLSNQAEQNRQGFEELSDAYGVEMTEPFYNMTESIRIFIAQTDKLILAIREQRARSMCSCEGGVQ